MVLGPYNGVVPFRADRNGNCILNTKNIVSDSPAKIKLHFVKATDESSGQLVAR